MASKTRGAKRSSKGCKYGRNPQSKKCYSKKQFLSKMSKTKQRISAGKVKSALQKNVAAKRSRKASAKRSAKRSRKPSAYNMWMKKQIPIEKAQGFSQTEAFKRAAKKWKFEKGSSKTPRSRTARSRTAR